MRLLKTIILTILCQIAMPNNLLWAQQEKDSISISLLTCSPGGKSFELFGHSAIRIYNHSNMQDVIYNYGVFSFNTPHFLYRFTKGETDYILASYDTDHFLKPYIKRNSTVNELSLNLSQNEAHLLQARLDSNALEENREYRYKFLSDNCATRISEMIESSLKGAIIYLPPTTQATTYRNIIHKYTAPDPWLTFGIDLALGSTIDKPINYKQEMFIPEIMEQAFQHAILIDSLGQEQKWITNSQNLYTATPLNAPAISPFATPIAAAFGLLLIVSFFTIYEWKKRKHFAWLDTLIYSIYGIVGFVIFFLMFFSTHEATFPNYNIFWVNPLLFFPAIAIWAKRKGKILTGFHFIYSAILLLFFIATPWLPQRCNAATIPLIWVLLLRSFSYLKLYYNRRLWK